jgi:peptidoglycan-associated lipoprotein
MIDKTFLKTAASLALVAMLLAGCTSTPSDDDLAATADVYGAEDAAKVDAAGSRGGIDSQAYDDAAAASLDTIFYFDFDKSELRVDVRAALDEHATYLRNKSGIVRLEGHADERGTREYNLALGERRANSVRDYMVVNGIANYRIEAISYGEERPLGYGSGESNWAQNRRVELVVVN